MGSHSGRGPRALRDWLRGALSPRPTDPGGAPPAPPTPPDDPARTQPETADGERPIPQTATEHSRDPAHPADADGTAPGGRGTRDGQGTRAGRPDRELIVALPRPPGRGGATSLDLTLPRGLWVPRRLDQDGLAAYEPDTQAAFLAAAAVLPPGPVFDVGANIGLYAALAGALFPERPVVAFEPTPPLADAARRVAATNHLDIRVEAVALGESDGTATLYLSKQTDASNSLLEEFRPYRDTVEVPLRRLDDYRVDGVAPVLLKVDTETTEPAVLRGGQRLLAEHRPWIVCEVLARDRAGDAIMALTRPLGYHWYRIDDETPLRPAAEIRADREHRNWLLVPEPPSDDYWDELAVWRRAFASLVS